jgi:hypothetical protein
VALNVTPHQNLSQNGLSHGETLKILSYQGSMTLFEPCVLGQKRGELGHSLRLEELLKLTLTLSAIDA